jgi:hypothetical protein
MYSFGFMGTKNVLNVHVLTLTWHEIGFEANLNLVILFLFLIWMMCVRGNKFWNHSIWIDLQFCDKIKRLKFYFFYFIQFSIDQCFERKQKQNLETLLNDFFVKGIKFYLPKKMSNIVFLNQTNSYAWGKINNIHA